MTKEIIDLHLMGIAVVNSIILSALVGAV